MSNGEIARYLSHPQVQIEPTVPVGEWQLTPEGRLRVEALAASGRLQGTTQVIASAERKAVETGEILARALGCALEIRPRMHENDRSATGYLPSAEFEPAADAFFAEPQRSIHGWESAAAAQARIAGEVAEVLSRGIAGDILFVGHGAVGTLLYCHMAKLPISRAFDQPAGGGNGFAFRRDGGGVLYPWQPLETL